MTLLSVKQVTERVPLSPDAIYRAVHRGELPGFKVCGRLMVDEGDLLAWVEAGRVRVDGRSVVPTERLRLRRGRRGTVVLGDEDRAA